MIRRVRPNLSRLPRLASALAFLPAGLISLLAASCAATTDTTTTTAIVPTSLTVDPSTFLGNVVCSNLPGALKSYVATLSETPKNGAKIDLASSQPMPCSQPIQFRYVQEGHEYTVAIDGYDVPATALVPCGGAESGSRYMLPAATAPSGACAAALTAGAVPIPPRWQTACGDLPSTPTTDGNVVASCDPHSPLNDRGTSAPTGITVDPRAALGALACTKENGVDQPDGTITFLDIEADDASLTSYLGLPCDDTAAKTYAKNLVPGTPYTFHIAAHDVSETPGAPKYIAVCSAVARAGFTVPAVCGPFTQP